jgi:ribosomal-protein-alanine N-acetyltransferase
MSQNQYQLAPIDRKAACAIIDWRYPPPYDLYNLDSDDDEQTVTALLDPDFAYYKITNAASELVAFCTFGIDARVPGGDYSADALDIGLGIRPDLIGKGNGASFIRAVLEFARLAYHPKCFRVTIAGFNNRARQVWFNAGFKLEQRFQRANNGMEFLVYCMQNQG